jgi:hypothetical protein
MSQLENYLNQHFPTGPQPELRAHFQKIGVRIRQEGSYIQFKYDQIAAKWTEAIMPECRGHILRHDAGTGWRFISRPFDKFFDLAEGRCPVFDPRELSRRLAQLSLTEKSDGSCLQLWWDQEWHVSTLGTIRTEQVQGQNFSLEDLFWSCVDKTALLGALHPENTYIFELCCAENAIQSLYDRQRVVLLGLRHTQSGQHRPPLPLPGVEVLSRLQPSELGITTLEALRRFVELAATDPRWGRWPEGFVLHQDFCPIAKVKNLRYLQKMTLDVQDPDPQQVEKRLRQAVVLASIDDLQPFLSAEQKQRAEQLNERWRSYWQQACEAIETLPRDLDAKGFAIAVQKTVFKALQAFFFQNREAIGRGEITLDALDTYRIVNAERIGAML